MNVLSLAWFSVQAESGTANSLLPPVKTLPNDRARYSTCPFDTSITSSSMLPRCSFALLRTSIPLILLARNTVSYATVCRPCSVVFGDGSSCRFTL